MAFSLSVSTCDSVSATAFVSPPVVVTNPAAAHPVAAPSYPRLNNIYPRGVKRGGEYQFKFVGERLADAEEIFLYSKGLTVKKIEPVEKNANQITVTIAVAEDARVGEHVVQVRTKTGISDYRSIWIGHLPELAEAEPNNGLDQPQKIELNQTITGIVQSEDVDYFSFTAKKGMRITAEVEAIRLAALFDPYIALLNKDRFELAVSDDTPLLRQDGFVSVVIPEDGEYFLQIRETSYGGNGNCHYRLHVGNFPRPTVAYPAGGKPGTKQKVTFIGDPAGDVEKEIDVPTEYPFREGLFYEDEHGMTPSPIAFRLSNLTNHLEVEPNNTFPEGTTELEAPIALNGIISTPGDVDFFKFKSKKGQVWDVECYARRIRSGLDPVINIYQGDKKHIKGDDDTRRPDCYSRFTAPADGDYFIRVRDHLMRGQADFVYRLEIKAVEPKLTLSIPRVDRYSQQRQTIAVPRGGRFATLLNATRADFGGEIALIEENLPAGIKMIAPPMRANLNVMPIVFEAAEDAPLAGRLIEFRGHQIQKVPAKDGKPETTRPGVHGSFENNADFVLGQPNNARYYGCKVEQLAVAVTEKIPFKLELVQPKVPLVRDGQMNIKIKVHRAEGYKSDIRLQLPFRPPGLGTNYQVVLPKDKDEVVYPVNANGNAQLGKWPIYAIGWGNNNGQSWASTQLAELTIAEPFVKMEAKRAVCEIGQTATLVCKLSHLVPFEGEATAEILGVPAHCTVAPQKFTKETTELSFPIQTTDKSKIGKHKSLFCRVTITQHGEPIVSTAVRCQLQINKPKPLTKEQLAAKKIADEAAAKKAAVEKAAAEKLAAEKAAAAKVAADKAAAAKAMADKVAADKAAAEKLAEKAAAAKAMADKAAAEKAAAEKAAAESAAKQAAENKDAKK